MAAQAISSPLNSFPRCMVADFSYINTVPVLMASRSKFQRRFRDFGAVFYGEIGKEIGGESFGINEGTCSPWSSPYVNVGFHLGHISSLYSQDAI